MCTERPKYFKAANQLNLIHNMPKELLLKKKKLTLKFDIFMWHFSPIAIKLQYNWRKIVQIQQLIYIKYTFAAVNTTFSNIVVCVLFAGDKLYMSELLCSL